MTQMKRVIALCGVVGLAGCFLPLISRPGISISWFTMRHYASSLGVYLVMLGFLVPVLAASLEERARVVALASVAGFGLVTWRLGFRLFDLFFTGIGGLVMTVACVAGLGVSLLALLASGNARRLDGFGIRA